MSSILSRFSNLDDFNNKVVACSFVLSLVLFAYSKHRLSHATATDTTYLAALGPFRFLLAATLYALPQNVHAISVTAMAVYVLILGELQAGNCWGTSFTATNACTGTIGYMFADLVHMIFSWKDQGGWSFVLHHALTAGAYTYVAYKGIFQHLAMIRLLAEFSTPFVILRYTLATLGLTNSKTYLYNGCAMVTAFTLARIATIPYFIYILFTLPNTASFQQVGLDAKMVFYASFAVLDGLNVYWFYLLVNGLIKLFKKTDTTSSKAELDRKNG